MSENGAVALLSGSFAPDLARVILAWPGLPDPTKQAILAMVRATQDVTSGRVCE